MVLPYRSRACARVHKRQVPCRRKSCSSSEHLRRRQGTAIVELAVCLPLLVFVVFVSIELCNAKHLKQALTEASYEGALVGSQPKATEQKIVQRIQTVLNARGITGSSIAVDAGGASFDDLVPGELFTVDVTAPVSENIIGPLQFVTSPTLNAEITGHKQE